MSGCETALAAIFWQKSDALVQSAPGSPARRNALASLENIARERAARWSASIARAVVRAQSELWLVTDAGGGTTWAGAVGGVADDGFWPGGEKLRGLAVSGAGFESVLFIWLSVTRVKVANCRATVSPE